MVSQENLFFYSEKWNIADDNAWFVGGNINALFHMDMKTNQCKMVTKLPGNGGFRLNSRCIKIGDRIFCMPVYGENIWCYKCRENIFKKIKIDRPEDIQPKIMDFWNCGNDLYAVSVGLKQIIEIDIDREVVKKQYDITLQVEEVSRSIEWEGHIYIASASKNTIYDFDVHTKQIIEYELSGIRGGLCTIETDGNSFWLSGFRKEIYVWNKERNETIVLDAFPYGFGKYNFECNGQILLDCESKVYGIATFMESISLNEYVWFIPYQTNKILYLNKHTNSISEMVIIEEEETERSLKQHYLKAKFVLEYIRDNRYIGIYSVKNESLFEIDTNEMGIKYMRISMDFSSLSSLFLSEILYEQRKFERLVYERLVGKNRDIEDEKENIGKKIYSICSTTGSKSEFREKIL